MRDALTERVRESTLVDINDMITAMYKQTEGVEKPDRVLITKDMYDALSS